MNIKCESELRPCLVKCGTENKKALFHCFTLKEGNAVVEFENGRCNTVDPWDIQFVDSKINGYCFQTEISE